jgi:DivIVA domain-containing protein
VDLDSQSIERRDFPISRRGYDPATVDAHLRQLATDVYDLQQALDERHGESLGSAAAGQVQSILEAAETTAADIEQQAAQEAAAARQAAAEDAQRTRDEAVARAQAHVQAVSQATAVLMEKVESMDAEVGALVQSLRAGASRLAADLRAVEVNMGELYDVAAAGGTGVSAAGARVGESTTEIVTEAVAVEAVTARAIAERPVDDDSMSIVETAQDTAIAGPAKGARPQPPPPVAPPVTAPVTAPASAPAVTTNGSAEHAVASMSTPTHTRAHSGGGGEEDLDGARLIALNMALNGEPREQADRYLADNFQLADRQKLLDEVYAAIEG